MISGAASSKVWEMRIKHDDAEAGTAAGEMERWRDGVGFNRAGGEVRCECEGCGESGALTDGGHGLGVAAVDAAANFVLAGPPRQSGGTYQTPHPSGMKFRLLGGAA